MGIDDFQMIFVYLINGVHRNPIEDQKCLQLRYGWSRKVILKFIADFYPFLRNGEAMKGSWLLLSKVGCLSFLIS